MGDHARNIRDSGRTIACHAVLAVQAYRGTGIGYRPLAVIALAPAQGLVFWVAVTSLLFLALLGALAARAGGAGMLAGAWRVTFWGALAMAITAGVGALFGTVV